MENFDLQKYIDKAKEYQKELTIGGAAVGAAFLLYLVTRKGGKKEETVVEPEQQQVQSLPQEQAEQNEEAGEKVKRAQRRRHQNTEQNNNQVQQEELQRRPRDLILKDILSKIQVKYIGQTQTLDLSTISAVLEYSIELAEEHYIQLTKENRSQRRQVMRSDPSKYEELIMQYNEQVEKVLIDAQEEMLQSLNIEKEQFEESVLQLMERGLYQQMYMLQAAIRQKIKEKIPATKEVSMVETKQVIQYQVKVLKDNPEFFKNIINKLQSNMETANMIPTVLNTMLQDLIYEEFAIEEEDQMKNMTGQQVLNDPEIHELLMQIEEAMFQLMGSMGMGGQGFTDM